MNMRQVYYFSISLFLLTLILNGCSSQILQEQPRKFALLIANQDYRQADVSGFGSLQTPVKDVTAITRALQKAGFKSFVYTDLSSKVNMQKALDTFLRQVKPKDDDIVWFYYAGHGVQENERNYLIPTQIDIRSNDTEELARKAMSAQYIMEQLQQHHKGGINIIVLDTCRSRLDKANATEPKNDLVGVGGGNVLVVFSTKSGEDAQDEAGSKLAENSPLAKYLIQGINQQSWQPLEKVLQTVGEEVRIQTKEQQQVYVYGWVGKPFCLSRCLNTQNVTITP